MDGKTHLVAGVLAGIGIVALENKLGIGNNLDKVLLVVGCGVGSLLPDTDHPEAPAGRILPLWIFFKHRTYTHSLFFVLSVGLIAVMFHANVWLTVGLVLGILTHLILDSTTHMGVNWIYPLKKE